jgi:hypothetical protein
VQICLDSAGRRFLSDVIVFCIGLTRFKALLQVALEINALRPFIPNILAAEMSQFGNIVVSLHHLLPNTGRFQAPEAQI